MGDNYCESDDARRLYVDRFCNICGRLLFPCETAAVMQGDYYDFETRSIGDFTFNVCSECWATIGEFDRGGLESAREKYQCELEEDKCHVTNVKTESGG